MKNNGFIREICKRTTPRYCLDLALYGAAVLLGSFVVGQSTKLLLNSLQEGQFAPFLRYILWGLLALAVSAAAGYFSQYSLYKQADRIGEGLFCGLMGAVLGMPYCQSSRYSTGDLESRMTFDVRSAIRVYRLDLSYIARLIIGGIGNLAFIFLINWKIGLLAIAFGLLGYGVNICFVKPIQKLARKLSQGYGDMTGTLLEMIQGSETIRVFRLQDWMNRRFDKRNQEMKAVGLKQNRVSVLQNLIHTLLGYLNTFLFLGICLLFLQKGQLLFGDVMAAFYYAQGVVNLFTDLSGAFANLQNSYASIVRINEIAGLPGEENPSGAAPALEGQEAVAFEKVSFSYEVGTPVLTEVSFQVGKGEVLWLKGPSGVGKTTVFKLLLNLFPGWTGDIRLFGKKVEEIPPGLLREQVAFVPQSPFFFKGSIYENIALAKPGASREEVALAAKRAQLDGFIAGLPQGYDTDIGEKGGLLSGGQRQRVAIARAFLKDAPVWMMDEPFSALDNVNAAGFYDAFAQDLAGKTVLLISHREDTQSLADRLEGKFKTVRL